MCADHAQTRQQAVEALRELLLERLHELGAPRQLLEDAFVEIARPGGQAGHPSGSGQPRRAGLPGFGAPGTASVSTLNAARSNGGSNGAGGRPRGYQMTSTVLEEPVWDNPFLSGNDRGQRVVIDIDEYLRQERMAL